MRAGALRFLRAAVVRRAWRRRAVGRRRKCRCVRSTSMAPPPRWRRSCRGSLCLATLCCLWAVMYGYLFSPLYPNRRILQRGHRFTDIDYLICNPFPAGLTMRDDDDKATSSTMFDNRFPELNETGFVQMDIRFVE